MRRSLEAFPLFVLLACALAVAACDKPPEEPAPSPTPEPAASPFFEGLGSHGRPVTGASPEAQRWFDQGLAFLYGFNHDEAIRSFRRAAELSPGCAMAYWGEAYAHGPHINNTAVPPPRAEAAWKALEQARAAAPNASEVEKGLIEALGARYAFPQPDDRAPLDAAYAEAMGKLWQAHPTDADVGALAAEALMDVHPWDQWTPEGEPKAGTKEILAAIESVLRLDPRHPLANHLYIHAVEASPHPELADGAAETLRTLMPGIGHMVHMPTHIDVLRGRWEQAIASNASAIAADRAYREKSPEQDFWNLYMAHDHHMLTFSAMMIGRSDLALTTIRNMVAAIPPNWLKANAFFADGFVGMPYEVMMRFGKWDEILAEPEPPEHLPVSRALRRYARGVALAALGRADEARVAQQEFATAAAAVPLDAVFGNNSSRAIVAIAEAVLDGEILVREGKTDAGIARLREAVALEDALRYDEPPSWIHPSRHALGASLLRAERWSEAETVFREDLQRHPNNGWALFGLAKALRAQGQNQEATEVERQFNEAWAGSDITLTSPCFCQPRI